MFGKRTTFGGNTPGAQEAPRPIAAPNVPAARTDLAMRSLDTNVGKPKANADVVVDVRNPTSAAR